MDARNQLSLRALVDETTGHELGVWGGIDPENYVAVLSPRLYPLRAISVECGDVPDVKWLFYLQGPTRCEYCRNDLVLYQSTRTTRQHGTQGIVGLWDTTSGHPRILHNGLLHAVIPTVPPELVQQAIDAEFWPSGIRGSLSVITHVVATSDCVISETHPDWNWHEGDLTTPTLCHRGDSVAMIVIQISDNRLIRGGGRNDYKTVGFMTIEADYNVLSHYS